MKCTKCEQEKSKSDFHGNVSSKTKLQQWCKICQLEACKSWRDNLTNEKYQAWVEKIAIWKKNNPEKVRMYQEKAKQKRQGKKS